MSNEQYWLNREHEEMRKAIDGGETAESWHKVHAQLLKSVADAQARLLAAENEISDKLSNLGAIFNQLRDGQTLAHKDLQAGIMSLRGKLDAIGAILAELLTVRRPAKRGKTLNPKTLGYRSGQMINEIFGKRRPAKRKR